jgi:hypothetical protein
MQNRTEAERETWQTKAMVSEQGGVSGERKEVDVKDYPREQQ